MGFLVGTSASRLPNDGPRVNPLRRVIGCERRRPPKTAGSETRSNFFPTKQQCRADGVLPRLGSRPSRPRDRDDYLATSDQARADVFAFIQRYNRNHRHSTLDHLTCEEADLRYRHELPLAA